MNKYFFLLLFSIASISVQAQQPLGLKECIDYGLEHHRSTKVYANERLIATERGREVRSAYLPKVNITGSLDNNLKVQESVLPAGVFGPTDTRIAFTKQYNSNISAQLDQPIYDQSLLIGLQANKYNNLQAELNQQLNQENIIYSISTAYYQIFVYREQLALLKENLSSFQEQVNISQLQVEKGVATEVDLNKIKVNYNNTQSQISVAESNLAVSMNQLKNAMGFPMDSTLAVDIPDSHETHMVAGIETEIIPNLTNRLEFRLSDVDVALLDIEQKRIKAGILPKLSFYARYGGNGFGDKLEPAVSTLNSFSAIGLKLSIPIFTGFQRSAQYNQAKYNWLNAQENQQLDKQNFQLEFENARTTLLAAQENLADNKENIQLAQSVFESTDLQYQKGVTDLTTWLNAQTSLKEAQTNYLNSLFNFYLARIDLEKAKGTLKNFHTSL